MIELLIATTISTFIMTGVLAMYSNFSRAREVQTRRQELLQTGRLAMDYLTHEIRIAGSNPTGTDIFTGAFPIQIAEGTRLRFQSDLPKDANADDDFLDVVDGNSDGDTLDNDENESGDAVLDDPNEDVEYVLDAGRLIRIERDGVTDTVLNVDLIAGSVESLEFQYFDLADTELTQPIDAVNRRRIDKVRINLELRTSTADAETYFNTGETFFQTLMFDSDVTMRNL